MEEKLEDVSLDAKALELNEKRLEESKVSDLEYILEEMKIAKIKYDRTMKELEERSKQIKSRTTRWYDYDGEKAAEQRRNCECCSDRLRSY